jgi:esterase
MNHRQQPTEDATLSLSSVTSHHSFFGNDSTRRIVSYRFLFVGLCLLSSASSFSWTSSSSSSSSVGLRQSRNGSSSRHNLLKQSSTPSSTTPTSTLQDTVKLQWTDLYTPQHTDDDDHRQQTPVLLLHGLLGSKRNFASLASSLGRQLERPRRICAVDLRNHGDSDHHSDMTYTAMAKDVLGFLDSQNLDRVILVGHSMGGKVAQAMSLMHPDRVEGLVVLDIAPVIYTSTDPHWKAVEDILHAMHAIGHEAVSAGKTELDKLLRPSIPDPALRAFVLTNYDNKRQAWKIPVPTIVHQLDCLAGFDIPVSTYGGDVFIINGGQSRFVRHAYMDRIAEFFPNHMLTTIRGAGHWVHVEAPDATVALLKRFLDR